MNLYKVVANQERHFVYAVSIKQAKYRLGIRLSRRFGRVNITDIKQVGYCRAIGGTDVKN